ncbi:MAG: YecR-like lipofamily protein [Zoogloeaceae bacterium]|nr:YecR-like lipofamily protein [Zoogloeaceae bacterium]
MCVALNACVSTPRVQRGVWQFAGGSRADGTVTLTMDYNPQVSVKVHSVNDIQKLAEQRCAVWGYKGAQAFGQITDSCIGFNKSRRCVSARFTSKYQCAAALAP